MKRLMCAALAVLLILTGCASNKNVIAEYVSPDKLPSCCARLYPEKSGDDRYAAVLRQYDGVETHIAVSDGLGGQMRTVYSLPEGTFAYELSAGGGLIAFYQLISYTDGSVNYALKVIDTENGNKVHSPYSKTVSDVSEMQTRFIVVFGGAVYYLTASAKLGRCRVMKYDTETEELSEYLSFDFIDSKITNGHSCTFISGRDGYLTCGVVSGGVYTIKTYNLRTGSLFAEKQMPENVGMIFYADYDRMTGVYALYYAEKADGSQGDERVGITTASAESVTDVFSDLDGAYICRDVVTVYNNLVCFNVEAADKTDGYGSFYGVLVNIADGSNVAFKGSLQLLIRDNDLFSLSFVKNKGYEKVTVNRTEIR